MIKINIISKFKEKRWCNKEEDKKKVKYYKHVIDHNLEDQKYLYVFTILKKKIDIPKVRTKSLEIHSYIGNLTIPKRPSNKIIWCLCKRRNVGNKNHFLI